MGYIILLVVTGLLAAGFFYLALEKVSREWTELLCVFLGGSFIVIFLCLLVFGVHYLVNDCIMYKQLLEETQLEYESYAYIAKKYAETDIDTPQISSAWLEQIIEFNSNVLAAKNHEGHWFCKGILYRPVYTNFELIKFPH